MFDILLQIDLETLRTVRQASEIIPMILGLAISYLAYTAYRQNQSRPMLYVAVGFILVLFVQAPLALILIYILDLPSPVVNTLLQIPEFAGLGLILYGLWTPRRG
jgi:ABC-type methionine transport system permease subunit